MEPIQYYEIVNKYDETYYAWGTDEQLARFLSWLEDTSKTRFVAKHAKTEDFKYCLCMGDVIGH